LAQWQTIAEGETRIRIVMEERLENQALMIAAQNRTIDLNTQMNDIIKTKLQEAEARAQAESDTRVELEARYRQQEAEIRRLRGEG